MSDPEIDVAQLQDDIVALVTAWADRGIAPSESAMVLAGMSHTMLAKLGYSLGEVTTLLAEGWKRHNGKL